MDIKRLLYKDLWREIEEPQVLILSGPRQVGKTTLLRALEAEARQAGMKTRYLDLEQPADLASLRGEGEEIIEALIGGVDIVFVDEFYYLEDAGRFFKAIFDRGATRGRRVKIIASGSSSFEIHGHLKESLAGRTITHRVFPLSYDEYRAWNSPKRPDLSDYLSYGGLPGLSTAGSVERKQRLLQDYLSTYLFKDVKGLVREKNIRAFNQLLYLLAQNQGQLVEVSNLARELGLTSPTIGNYLNILDQTFVNFQVPSYHTNLANELKKSRKTYLYDLGIRNSILKDFRPPQDRDDGGCIYETYVFLSLLPLLTPNMELRFWRTKKGEEVDFVLVKNRQPHSDRGEGALGAGGSSPGCSGLLPAIPDRQVDVHDQCGRASASHRRVDDTQLPGLRGGDRNPRAPRLTARRRPHRPGPHAGLHVRRSGGGGVSLGGERHRHPRAGNLNLLTIGGTSRVD